MLDGVFGTGKTPAERIKEYNRQIKKSVREIDRERTALERQEKKLLADIKKAAKDGQMDSAKIMAKDLVRTRGYIKKMFKMKAHMEAVSLRLQTMSSSAQMAQCMKGVTKVMGKMNAKMSSANIQKIMMEFEKQNEMMGMKEEMMGDAMDDAFADEEDSEEEDSILGSVLAEIGVELDNKMMGASTAPMQAAASTAAAEPQGARDVAEMQRDAAELQRDVAELQRDVGGVCGAAIVTSGVSLSQAPRQRPGSRGCCRRRARGRHAPLRQVCPPWAAAATTWTRSCRRGPPGDRRDCQRSTRLPETARDCPRKEGRSSCPRLHSRGRGVSARALTRCRHGTDTVRCGSHALAVVMA